MTESRTTPEQSPEIEGSRPYSAFLAGLFSEIDPTARELIQRLTDALKTCREILVGEGLWDGDDSDPFYGLEAEACDYLDTHEPAADGPAVPDGREPASVTHEPSDDEELLGLDDLRNAWNAQSDPANSWDELGLDEIVCWAQRQALARWGRQPPQPIPLDDQPGSEGPLTWFIGDGMPLG